MKIEILRKRSKWYWRIKAGNGEIWTVAETFYSKTNAKKSAEKFLKEIRKAKIVIINK